MEDRHLPRHDVPFSTGDAHSSGSFPAHNNGAAEFPSPADSFDTDAPPPEAASEAAELDAASAETSELEVPSAAAIESSQPHIQAWNHLVSTTNWEKGRIIALWRSELQESNAAPRDYSDEAWARLVGGVTGQHAGRLRRVWQRFGESYTQYEGLYWSHFQAALDWDDAELWLEGAVQNGWSVAAMRNQRWQALDAPPELKPRDDEIVSTELDEDFEPAREQSPQPHAGSEPLAGNYEELREPPVPEGPDFGDESPSHSGGADFDPEAAPVGDYAYEPEATQTAVAARPFAAIGTLPDDVAEAFEAFKLAILRHKADQWQAIAQDDLLGVLESLRDFALAPPSEEPA